jgi:type VI secretion system protein ImpA
MDLAPLLAPIAAQAPTGTDLSFSPEMDAIQEMRREDDPTLEQGEWATALKTADWPGVARGCESLLRTRSKDLRVVGWLTDAWARLRGFAGLADGIELATGLVDDYWDRLHPLDEDGDPEERIGNLRWLAACIDQRASTIALVAHGERRASLADIASARSRRLLACTPPETASPQESATAPADPAPTLETLWRDVIAAGREAAAARRAEVARTRTALTALQTAVDRRLGGDAPSFVAPRVALDKALDELGRLERECNFGEASATADTSAPPAPADAPPALAAAPTAQRRPDRIETRAQALDQLRLVAAFFRATEPHSPVAYLADKAVRWSDMPLHAWLREVVKDSGSLEHLEEMLGTPKTEAP